MSRSRLGGRLGGLAGGCLGPDPGGGGGSGRGPVPHLGSVQTHTLGVQAHTRGGGCSGPDPKGCIPACTEADTPSADGYCCWRYASYWNAFLLNIKITLICFF